jgi:hypothetical protein
VLTTFIILPEHFIGLDATAIAAHEKLIWSALFLQRQLEVSGNWQAATAFNDVITVAWHAELAKKTTKGPPEGPVFSDEDAALCSALSKLVSSKKELLGSTTDTRQNDS